MRGGNEGFFSSTWHHHETEMAFSSIVLTPPSNLATDILKNVPLLITLSNNKVDVIEPQNGARHGTSMGRPLLRKLIFSACHIDIICKQLWFVDDVWFYLFFNDAIR